MTDRSRFVNTNESKPVQAVSHVGAVAITTLLVVATGIKVVVTAAVIPLYAQDKPTNQFALADMISYALYVLAFIVFVVVGIGTRLANKRNGA